MRADVFPAPVNRSRREPFDQLPAAALGGAASPTAEGPHPAGLGDAQLRPVAVRVLAPEATTEARLAVRAVVNAGPQPPAQGLRRLVCPVQPKLEGTSGRTVPVGANVAAAASLRAAICLQVGLAGASKAVNNPADGSVRAGLGLEAAGPLARAVIGAVGVSAAACVSDLQAVDGRSCSYRRSKVSWPWTFRPGPKNQSAIGRTDPWHQITDRTDGECGSFLSPLVF